MRIARAALFTTLLASCAVPPRQAGTSLAQEPSIPANPLERLDVYGDLRLRQESTLGRDGSKDRSRQRLRGRLGANYQTSEEIRIGARLVTGDRKDPNSPYATLGDGLDGLEVSLDRLFLDYRPAGSPGTRVTAGKFDNDVDRNPVYGELVWDADVQPEGALVKQALPDAFGLDDIEVTLGAYVLLEQSEADDASLFVSEVAASRHLGEQRTAHLSLAYYFYPDPTPDGSMSLVDKSAGNEVEDGEFVSDFGILDANASLRIGGDRPWTLSGEFMHNLRADDDRRNGWATGISYGTAAKRGDWRAYYQWQVVEQDAVFSAFAQDDFVFRTNHRSHVAGYQRKLTDDLELHFWALYSQSDKDFADGSDENGVLRLRLDLNVKF